MSLNEIKQTSNSQIAGAIKLIFGAGALSPCKRRIANEISMAAILCEFDLKIYARLSVGSFSSEGILFLFRLALFCYCWPNYSVITITHAHTGP